MITLCRIMQKLRNDPMVDVRGAMAPDTFDATDELTWVAVNGTHFDGSVDAFDTVVRRELRIARERLCQNT